MLTSFRREKDTPIGTDEHSTQVRCFQKQKLSHFNAKTTGDCLMIMWRKCWIYDVTWYPFVIDINFVRFYEEKNK